MADLVMHKLSPATKAVVLAFTNDPDWMKICKEERVSLAAALRAAAEQGETLYLEGCPVHAVTVGNLLAIATELEA